MGAEDLQFTHIGGHTSLNQKCCLRPLVVRRYGHLPWLLSELDDEGETFLAEIHANQGIYLENPHPGVPERTSSHGNPLTENRPKPLLHQIEK